MTSIYIKFECENELKEWEEQHDNILNGHSTMERVRKIYGNKIANRIQEKFDERELMQKRIYYEIYGRNKE